MFMRPAAIERMKLSSSIVVQLHSNNIVRREVPRRVFINERFFTMFNLVWR